MIVYYLFSIQKVSTIYIDKTQDTILQMKKDFIKDTVNNLLTEIDTERKAKAEYFDHMIEKTSAIIHLKMPKDQKSFCDFIINFFLKDSDFELWTVLIWDKKANQVIYDQKLLGGESWEDTLANVKTTLSSYRLIKHGDNIAVFGISKKYINDVVKEEMSQTIRNLKFGDDSYLWVNEIIHYEGGKNYAIRRVHPNLIETEGSYLSTDTTDEKGNYPYLTELQGIKKDGELFFTYFFKELNSNTISEKLTFAKLYKDFNWVIAMGVYQKDLQSYIDHTNKVSGALVSKLTFLLVFLFVVIMMIGYLVVLITEKWHFRNSKRLLESEINQDQLTKSGSRRSGTKELIRLFKEYKKNGISPGIMMFDLDYFKKINDNYGHATGDLVLSETVKVISEFIRSSDRVIRWGGDEFIVIFYGLPQKHAVAYGNKLLTVASSIKFPEQKIHLTLSIGFSYFKSTDVDYTKVLERADQALYQSKINGRNQVHLIL